MIIAMQPKRWLGCTQICQTGSRKCLFLPFVSPSVVFVELVRQILLFCCASVFSPSSPRLLPPRQTAIVHLQTMTLFSYALLALISKYKAYCIKHKGYNYFMGSFSLSVHLNNGGSKQTQTVFAISVVHSIVGLQIFDQTDNNW